MITKMLQGMWIMKCEHIDMKCCGHDTGTSAGTLQQPEMELDDPPP
jgi:hypothetical protein